MQEFDLLASIIQEHEGIAKETLLSKSRKRPIVELRMVCSNILRTSENDYTLEEIGKEMNIDHATVLYHYKVHNNLMDAHSSRYRNLYEKILKIYDSRDITPGENMRIKLLKRKRKLIEELKSVNKSLKELGNVPA